ncbi:MAG: DUF4259 domain-containing protein [Oscillospiraceae bacterium]|jgi:hypothetical protein|nr:DUF4259 domain-containing protein [Oscillospiraceae bacterium]
MGAWNYQILCDDVALDVIEELEELDESEDMVRALNIHFDNALAKPEYIEYTEGVSALTCAALIDAAINGIELALLTDNEEAEEAEQAEALAEQIAELNLFELRDKAIASLELVISDGSEINELWGENEELYPLWMGNVHAVMERLRRSN